MHLTLSCGHGRHIRTELPAFIMGIINVTPDSFFIESCSIDNRKNLERALCLAEEGADILDIGGESTRPGAAYISAEEELERVIPVLEAIRRRIDIPVSVDTRKAVVMQEAFRAGADICNDIAALSDDPALGAVIAKQNGAVVLMHKRGIPATMQQGALYYSNIIQEVSSYLLDRAAYAVSCGIKKEHIILDYGIGFGKTAEDNYRLIAATGHFAALGYPLLAGLSRKSFIGAVTGEEAGGRLTGSLAAAQYAVQHGAAILRVHDVAQTRSMLRILKELNHYGSY